MNEDHELMRWSLIFLDKIPSVKMKFTFFLLHFNNHFIRGLTTLPIKLSLHQSAGMQ